MTNPPIDRQEQAKWRYRAKIARHGKTVWPAHRGTYDPFGKVMKAWREWAERRRKRETL